MLPKSSRLSRKYFLLVKKTSKSIRTPLGTMLVSPLLSGQSHGQISVVTSAKLHKSAVVRNRLRRLIYSGLSKALLSNNLIIYPLPSLLAKSSEELIELSFTCLHPYLIKTSPIITSV